VDVTPPPQRPTPVIVPAVPASRPPSPTAPSAPKPAGDRVTLSPQVADPRPGQTFDLRYVFPDGKFDGVAIKPDYTEVASARPLVFFNYNETLMPGDAGRGFTPIGHAALTPGAASFELSGSHANGSNESALLLGARFTNTSDQELVLTLTDPEIAHHGKPPSDMAPALRQPDGSWQLTVPPGRLMDIPLVGCDRHGTPNPRDASRWVTYSSQVKVLRGDPRALQVLDVGAFPDQLSKPIKTIPPTLHHEGVFRPMIQSSDPPPLDALTALYVRIQGGPATHDAHYLVSHTVRFSVDPAATLVFRGPGGMVDPEFGNGKKLPNPVFEADFTVDADRFRIARKAHEERMTVADAVANGFLRDTGAKDENGHPVYEMTVRFLPGSNGDLDVFVAR